MSHIWKLLKRVPKAIWFAQFIDHTFTHIAVNPTIVSRSTFPTKSMSDGTPSLGSDQFRFSFRHANIMYLSTLRCALQCNQHVLACCYNQLAYVIPTRVRAWKSLQWKTVARVTHTKKKLRHTRAHTHTHTHTHARQATRAIVCEGEARGGLLNEPCTKTNMCLCACVWERIYEYVRWRRRQHGRPLRQLYSQISNADMYIYICVYIYVYTAKLGDRDVMRETRRSMCARSGCE